jgi:hypothetical protein
MPKNETQQTALATSFGAMAEERMLGVADASGQSLPLRVSVCGHTRIGLRVCAEAGDVWTCGGTARLSSVCGQNARRSGRQDGRNADEAA